MLRTLIDVGNRFPRLDPLVAFTLRRATGDQRPKLHSLQVLLDQDAQGVYRLDSTGRRWRAGVYNHVKATWMMLLPVPPSLVSLPGLLEAVALVCVTCGMPCVREKRCR